MPLAIALLLLSTRLPVPVAPPDRVNSALPLALLFVSVVPPLFTVSAPLTVSAEVVLFSVIPVTFDPTPALMSVTPLPLPLLVIVPVLLTEVVDTVMPLAVALLLLSTRLPVPLTPPEIVCIWVPLLSVPVVPPLSSATAPRSVSAEVVLFSVIPVTFEPTPVLIVVVPVPAPVFVMVPALFTAAVDSVTVPVVALLLIVRLL